MNKVICDMCGTSYAESASQCPICGYARQEDAKVIIDPDSTDEPKYAHVRGGRFSAANVRKINSVKEDAGAPDDYDSDEPEKTRSGLNIALAITAIVLFIMLVAVLISFGMKIAENAGNNNHIIGNETTTQKQDASCSSIELDTDTVTLAAVGDMHVIQYSTVPAKTTEKVSFSSSNPEVATVGDDGRITAVSGGEAVITISCGKVNKNVTVTCAFEAEAEWSLNREEFSLLKKGETWDLYSNSSKISKVNITWKSDDENVATVDSGIVTAVGPGTTTIHAEYNGKKLSCTVRCKFEDENQNTSNGSVDIDSLQMSKKSGDVTLVANGQSYEKSFELYLVDKNGTQVDVTWTPSKEGVVQIEGRKITGIKAGSVTVLKATYEGKTFECTVRVRNN